MAGSLELSGNVPAASGARFMLRPDLRLTRWDDGDDGRPRWLVHDPVVGSREQVAWPECLIILALRRPARLADIVRAVADASPLRPTVDDVAVYVAALGKRGWLRGLGAGKPSPEPPARWLSWLVERYFYMRIPLWHPDGFLRRTLPLARLLARPAVVWLVAAAILFGLYLALPRWEEMAADLRQLLHWRRLVGLVPLIPLVKLVHELAHAYAAKASGARVGSMGVALIFLLPLPYVDVSDAWKLSRRRRLWVATAGVAAELVVGGLALLVWALAPPGGGRLGFLLLATTALVSTLIANLNPGMRFDGYFILSNLIGVENLRGRAIAYLRRWYRRRFLGMVLPEPESALRPAKRAGLLFYAVYAWCYRVALCFGIVFMVYRTLPKALGLCLFAVVAWLLLVRPALGELLSLAREAGRMRLRAMLAVAAVAAAAWWFVGSMPRRASFPAVARRGETASVRVVHAGEVKSILKREGDAVWEGDTLAVIDSSVPALERERSLWLVEEALAAESASLVDPTLREDLIPALARSLARSRVVSAWDARIQEDVVKAPASGMVAELPPGVAEGVYLPRGGLLAVLEADGEPHAVALVDIALGERLDRDAPAWFYPDDGGEPVPGRILGVDSHRLDVTADSLLAGLTPTVRERDGWRLVEPRLRLRIALDAPPARSGQTGRVWVKTKPYSLAVDAWNWLSALAVRESGF